MPVFKAFLLFTTYDLEHRLLKSQPLINSLPAIDGELSDFVRSLPAVHFGHKGGYRIGVGWFEVG